MYPPPHVEERLMRERAKETPKQHELDYWEEFVVASKKDLAQALRSRDSYHERLHSEVKKLPGGTLPRHPLKYIRVFCMHTK
jgi:hypothetical protein